MFFHCTTIAVVVGAMAIARHKPEGGNDAARPWDSKEPTPPTSLYLIDKYYQAGHAPKTMVPDRASLIEKGRTC